MQITFSRRRTAYLGLFLGIISIFSLVSFVAANAAFWVNDEIFQGVMVDNVDLGGLSQQAANDKLTAVINERLSQKAILVTNDRKTLQITPEMIGLTIDINKMVVQAYEIGRSGSFFNQLKERYLTINYGKTLPLATAYDHDKLVDVIQNVAYSIDSIPRNASVTSKNAQITIVPEVIGQKVDVQKTVNAIEDELRIHSSFSLPFVTDTVTPGILATDLSEIDSVLASYSTQFNSSDFNRSQNVFLAAERVNGILLKPNQIFSFNDSVGSRLAQFGFKEAPVFIDGKLVPDIGGGVCQVSSTLYNAVLLADMAIVERTAHFSPPSYVPLGQDATVADNLLDFRFKNTLASPIYVASEIYGDRLNIIVYGKSTPGSPAIEVVATDKKVIDPTTVIKQDPLLNFGVENVVDPGQRGYQITTYRIKSLNGKEISRELLDTDDFPPSDRVVIVGTKTSSNQIKK